MHILVLLATGYTRLIKIIKSGYKDEDKNFVILTS
jgi:hypothetical protein